MKRPDLALALDRLRRGHVLVVVKMDRLSRSLIEYASIVASAQRDGWALVALDSAADMTTPQGEAMARMQAVSRSLSTSPARRAKPSRVRGSASNCSSRSRPHFEHR